MSKRRRDSGKDTKGQPPPPPKPTKSSAASVFVDVTKADTQVLLVKVPVCRIGIPAIFKLWCSLGSARDGFAHVSIQAMLYDLWKETGMLKTPRNETEPWYVVGNLLSSVPVMSRRRYGSWHHFLEG
jgi:hypothetical protein